AIAQLEQATSAGRLTPLGNPEVYAALGRAYAVHGEQEKAAALWEECVRQVAQEAPEDAAARVRFATYLSYALADLGQFERAERGAAHAALAEGLLLLGDRAGADEAFRQSISLLSEQKRWREAAEAARTWGRSLREAGREREALDVFEQAAELASR